MAKFLKKTSVVEVLHARRDKKGLLSTYRSLPTTEWGRGATAGDSVIRREFERHDAFVVVVVVVCHGRSMVIPASSRQKTNGVMVMATVTVTTLLVLVGRGG